MFFSGLKSEIEKIKKNLSDLQASLIGGFPPGKVLEGVGERLEEIDKSVSELKEGVSEKEKEALSAEIKEVEDKLSNVNDEFLKITEFYKDLREAKNLYISGRISESKYKKLKEAIKKKYRREIC